MIETVRRLFAHLTWADAEILRLLEEAPEARAPAALVTFAHLLAAERIWLLRLRGEDTLAEPVWPDLPLERLRPLAAGSAAGYARYLEAADDAEMRREVAYRNSRGERFRTAAGDVLLHVALHGSYHRGQVAAAVRAGGGAPVNTDFVAFVRAGAPSPQPVGP